MYPVYMRPESMRRFTAGGTGMTGVKGGMNKEAKNKEVMNAGTSGTMKVGVVAVVVGGTTGAMVIAEGHALGP